jgi:hypothetical protein
MNREQLMARIDALLAITIPNDTEENITATITETPNLVAELLTQNTSSACQAQSC